MLAEKKWQRFLPAIIFALVIVLVGYGVFWLKTWLSDNTNKPAKVVQQIMLITPPPPPPLEQQPPPEPEVEEVELEEEAIEDIVDETSEPPAGSELGVDAQGTAGGDGFGLIGKKGGRGLLNGGPYAWYAGLMEREITDLLSDDEDFKKSEFTIEIKLWISFSGEIEKISLPGSAGNKKVDRKIVQILNTMKKFSQMPPGKMPQPVHLKIISSI